MATNTVNPWAAGAVVFDTRPWAAFYERQALRQQAKSDAYDNYFRDLEKNITTEGVRAQDVPDLLKKNKDWQNFYQANKSAIINPKLDNGAAYSEYKARYQDQLGHISTSKEASKSMMEIGKLRLNPKMSYVFDDPKFMDDIQAHELPISDPNRRAINLATTTMPMAPLETKDREEYRKYLAGDLKTDAIPGAPMNLGNFKTRTPITHQYSDANLKVIGERAMDAYDTDRRWRLDANNIFKEIMHDPIKYDQLNSVYKKAFGNDIDSPREARAASDMLANRVRNIEYKETEDSFGKSKALAAINHGYRMSEMEARQRLKGASDADSYDIVESLYNTLKDDAKKSPKIYKSANGRTDTQYEMKPSGAVKAMFAIQDAYGHKVYPDAIRYTDDFKSVTPIFLEHIYDKNNRRTEEIVVGSNGKSMVVKELSQPMLEAEFKQRFKKELMGTSVYGKSLGKKPAATSNNKDDDPFGIFND